MGPAPRLVPVAPRGLPGVPLAVRSARLAAQVAQVGGRRRLSTPVSQLRRARRPQLSAALSTAQSLSEAANVELDSAGARLRGEPREWDCIVVGGGHNGLTCASYLAGRGLSVLVLESRGVLGGAAVTEEVFAGYKFSRASYLAGLLRPSVISELGLEGLRYLARDPSSFTPSLPGDPVYGGRSLVLGSDTGASARSIAQFSARDAERYAAYEEMLSGVRHVMEPLLEHPLPQLGLPSSWRELSRSAAVARALLGALTPERARDAYELLLSPAAAVLDRWFESDMLKATLATDAVIGAVTSPRLAGSAYVLLHHVMGQVNGAAGAWAYVEGGMGAISESLARSARRRGAVLRTAAPVDEILVDAAGAARGVRLRGGERLGAKLVVSAVTPYRTACELLRDDAVRGPDARWFRDRLRSADQTCGAMKINLALDRLPRFGCIAPDDLAPLRGTVHLVNRMDEIERAYREAAAGRAATRPVIELTIPSTLDATLVDQRMHKGHHVAQLFVQFAPYDLAGGNSWADPAFKDNFVRRCIDIVDEFAPGFRDSVVCIDALSPLDLETTFGLTKGNIFHGALALHQLAFARPVPGFHRHRTPLRGLYLASAGTHPGGGVMGACGRNCAQIVQDDLMLFNLA
jgi:phytoene dehydrogenase-like protein